MTAKPSADKILGLSEPFTPPASSPHRPPTPAQRVRWPSTPEPQIQSTPSPHNSSPAPAPPSSFPVHVRRNIMRRIPHPGLPPPPTDRSGPTQILVPNSDTSGTQSQSQSQNQTQSQPRSQPLSESQSHRPAFPSQLTQEFKPGQTSTPTADKQGQRTSKQPESHRDGDRTSSPGFTLLDVHEGLGHGDHQPSRTSPEAPQALEALVIEIQNTGVDAVDGADTVAVLQGVPPQVPDEPLNESKHIATPSPTLLHSPLHSLFSGSSYPSTSQSQLIPHVISQATSPHLAEPIASTSRVLLHDAEAWKQPTFMSAQKGKGRDTELNEKPYETRKRKRLSPGPSSPLASRRRRKLLEEKMTEPYATQPANEDEKPTPIVSNKKGNHTMESNIVSDLRKESLSIEQLSLPVVSTHVSQSQDAPPGPRQPGHKKRKTRLLGYQVDFDDIPVDVKAPNTWMNMRHIRTILLRTGRIRTLGDEVIRDGSIYTRSD